jgi:murein L,D-transpeptidase YcbB/YkuD
MGTTLRIIFLLTILFSSIFATKLDVELSIKLKDEDKRVKSIYKMNSNHPLWVGHAKNFHTLTNALQNPYYNYKDKNFYQDIIGQYSYILQDGMNVDENAKDLAILDIALTKSYMELAKFIVKSDVNWDSVLLKLSELKETKDIKANWEMVKKSEPSVKKLFNGLIKENIEGLFNSLIPLKDRYSKLIESLQIYRGMPNPPKIPYSKNFKGFRVGDVNRKIVDIKRRLAISGDYPRGGDFSDVFDNKLKYAISSYKERFNLEQNGVIDKVDIYYMNKPIGVLIRSIITNLDKLKVFPNRFPSEYILVNIPDFTMDYFKNGRSVLHMNAVIGRDERPTPIFQAKMTYLELNPNWNIPENLVRRDLIPTLEEQPDYMEKHNIHAFKGWGKNSREVKNLNIAKLLPYKDEKKGHIPYRFVQFPGDDNALGRIKFMFPNKYSVYLHDTDNKSLFSRRYRVYSSGCMRISKPFELLDALKPHLRAKDIKQIDRYRNNLKNKIFRFTKPLTVQTAYFTVFNKNGQTFFRKDIYGYDRMIEESVIEDESSVTLY